MDVFLGALFVLPFLVSVGRGAQELGTVTRIVAAGRARIVVAVAKRRIIVAFGLLLLLCCPRVSKVSTVTGIGGRESQHCRRFWLRLLSSHLRRAPHVVLHVLHFLLFL